MEHSESESISPDQTTALFKKIRRIHFQTTHPVNSILAGAYKSAFKGRGMEFEEVREYQSGDEIRLIDWNVTARMNHPYVKNFREERELTVTLIVDISASTNFGSGHHLKSELIAEISALLAFSAIKNHDKVALILFTDRVEKYFPPRKGTRHVLRIIRELLTYKSEKKGTNIGSALSFLSKVQKQSSICFLISDGISPDYSKEVAIGAKKHDLILLAITDPCEFQLPNLNLATFSDLETGEEKLIDTSSKEVENNLKESTEQRLNVQRNLMQRYGASFLKIDTDQSYIHQLRLFFVSRQRGREKIDSHASTRLEVKDGSIRNEVEAIPKTQERNAPDAISQSNETSLSSSSKTQKRSP